MGEYHLYSSDKSWINGKGTCTWQAALNPRGRVYELYTVLLYALYLVYAVHVYPLYTLYTCTVEP